MLKKPTATHLESPEKKACWDKFCDIVDKTNEKTGQILAWGTVVILLIMVYEIVARYVFNSPTSWAWKINKQLFSATMIMGGGYVLLIKGHVKLDLIYERVGAAKKRLFDILTFPFFLLIFGIVIWQGWRMAYSSVAIGEHDIGLFQPPLYFNKLAFFIGVILIFLQGIASFIRKLRKTEKVEDKTDNLFSMEAPHDSHS
jgi:TRAP-type mannitol/chloroaromatic compound transport system permease small subunit